MAPTPYKVQATPAASTEWNEFNIQGLYLFRNFGADANQGGIVPDDAKIGIGATVVNNWAVYDRQSQAQSLLPVHKVFISMPANGFRGSTLEVRGIVVNTGESAVVGGTGQFAMATGVISKKLHSGTKDRDIVELTIRAFCPQLKGTMYTVTKMGPYGGSGGSPMDIKETPRRLESITVATGWVLDSICFSYIDYTGQKRSAGRWGGPGGDPHTIQLGEYEVVTEVSVTVGSFKGHTVISSIKFVTNLNKTYGPWGDGNGKDNPFTIPVQLRYGIVGFFACAHECINSIGVHVRPL